MGTSDTPDQTRPTALSPAEPRHGGGRAEGDSPLEDGSPMLPSWAPVPASANEAGTLKQTSYGNEPGTLKEADRVKVRFPPLPDAEQTAAPETASGEASSGLSEVRVRGYDPEQKKEIVGRVEIKGQGGDETLPMMGAQLGASAAVPPADTVVIKGQSGGADVALRATPLSPVPAPVPIPYPSRARKITGIYKTTNVVLRRAAVGVGALVVLGLVTAALVTQPWSKLGPQPAAFSVTGATASVTPSTGSCGGANGPFTFEGVIRVSPASGGTVQFHWERSDGTSTTPESVPIAAGETTAIVHHPWVAPAPTHPGSYWGQLVTTAPNSVTSNQATFTIPQC